MSDLKYKKLLESQLPVWVSIKGKSCFVVEAKSEAITAWTTGLEIIVDYNFEDLISQATS